MRSSTLDYARPNKAIDWMVLSYDGFNSYLLVLDEALRYAWVFLTKSKDSPLDIIGAFFALHGHPDGGCLRTDQGGELASSTAFGDLLLWDFPYTLEPTGADSPSQNGAVEIYNDKFGTWTRSLLYGSGLPAKYWSAALVHLVYLHNRLVHSATGFTPFEMYNNQQPNLEYLKTFGSQVCVKRSGNRNAKLDKHNFHGIFLGFTSTDQNIIYLDLDTGIVKQSHHATFDEAWYLQPSHPLVAQLFYDLGLEAKSIPISSMGPLLNDSVGSQRISTIPLAPWPPPCPVSHLACKWAVPPCPRMLPLPLCETELPHPLTAAAACVRVSNPVASEIATEYDITRGNLLTVYMLIIVCAQFCYGYGESPYANLFCLPPRMHTGSPRMRAGTKF